MSAAAGLALQRAVFAALRGDEALRGLVGEAVHDAAPEGGGDLYVALGPERVRAAGDATGGGSVHVFDVSAVTARAGFGAAKAAAARVCDVLDGARLPLERGRLVSLRFRDARAWRDRAAGTRRVDLRFRARLDLSDS